MKSPFLRPAPDYYPVREIEPVSVEDRLSDLVFFDSAKLQAVIAWPGTQKSVKLLAKIFLIRRGINADKSGG